MPSPFPGMNPYLENPVFWREVHNRLIVNLADSLAPQLPPQYRVAIEQRTYLSDESDSVLVGIPDGSTNCSAFCRSCQHRHQSSETRHQVSKAREPSSESL